MRSATKPLRSYGFPYRSPTVPKGVEVPAQPSTLGAQYETEWARTPVARAARGLISEGPLRLLVRSVANPEVVGLDRNPPEAPGRHRWDPAAGALDADAFAGVDAVVNLTGAPIGDRRWTDARKQLIWDSRIGTTKLLADTMANLAHPPRVFVSQSAMRRWMPG